MIDFQMIVVAQVLPRTGPALRDLTLEELATVGGGVLVSNQSSGCPGDPWPETELTSYPSDSWLERAPKPVTGGPW